MNESIERFLKSRKGIKYLLWLNDEYGTWNEEKQCYDMPFDQCLELTIDELKDRIPE